MRGEQNGEANRVFGAADRARRNTPSGAGAGNKSFTAADGSFRGQGSGSIFLFEEFVVTPAAGR